MMFCSVDKCSYPNFGKDKITGLPYCRNHQTKRTDLDRRSIIQKAMSKEKRLGGKIRSLNNDEEKNEMVLWYLGRKYEMTGRCCECGGKTFADDNKKYKWSVAHIAPKALVPSVSKHSQNWLELCWQHHSDFDSTFDKAKSMQCFAEAKRKFNQFKHLIPAEEMRKVNPYLLEMGTINVLQQPKQT